MARGRLHKTMVRRWADGVASGRTPDQVLVEEPIEIRLDDHLVGTTMRTPGHDYDLAVGYCHSEGLLAGHPVLDVRYCALGTASDANWNVVSVSTGGLAPVPTPRLTAGTSACGWCGTDTIDDLATRWEPLDATATAAVDWSIAAVVGDAVRPTQELFSATGGAHAAALFDRATGEVRVMREDIGRHNAVDKVVGSLVLNPALLPTDGPGLGLWVSARLGFELVAKAWSAGIGVVVSVGPPSSLAIETARRANIATAGFARDGRLVIYD